MKFRTKIFIGLGAVILIVGISNVYKPLPEGLSMQGESRNIRAEGVHFFGDFTYVDNTMVRHSEQEIFDEILRMIDEAQSYILVDMFFYSDFLGTGTTSYRELSKELTDALVLKKLKNPDITIQVISDPINNLYGGYESPHFRELSDAGILVIVTDLTRLRDSNPLYSAFWRVGLQWYPDWLGGNFLPSLLDSRKPNVPLSAYINSFNFKANHRKVVVADYERDGKVGIATLITSANPHDGSSAHSNTAMRIDDALWRDVILSERSVAQFSGVPFTEPKTSLTEKIQDIPGSVVVELLTERAIKEKAIAMIDSLEDGDTFDMAMFYISDRDIVKALKRAILRGVEVRLLFDANKDAFGREKNGVPNRQVAHELMSLDKENLSIRWCDTHGEQCHSKLLIASKGDMKSIIQGSANFTRRNLNNLNLESSVYVSGDRNLVAMQKAQEFFDRTWNNNDGKVYSTAYETYDDSSILRTIYYRIGEFTGMSRY
jgi:phosphatidylserine/phosphatidylglycerophosphate/cardiolipin synthase-like enzyme